MPEYKWPPMNKRKIMGQRISRLDGPAKSSGRAKYPSDLNPQGLLHGVMVTSPYAHAKIRSIDTSAAKAIPGVTAVRNFVEAGAEIQWAGAEIVAISATTEEAARDAVRAVKIDWEVLPHVVKDENLAKVGTRAKAAGEQITGDPDKALAEADVKLEADYGIPVITHCCLEPHGQVISWKGDQLDYWPSTQAVSTVATQLATLIGVPATQINVTCDYMGGGFGSKFPPDTWGAEAAKLSKESGGRPVKLFLDRATELTIAGVRPSHYAKIKIGAKSDGTITAWQSDSWSSGGFGGGGMAPIPYVFVNIPNRRNNHAAVALNAGPQRAWRAPNHPQASFLTCSALTDLAAKLNMDPLALLQKNAGLTLRADTYKDQLNKAAELMDWKNKYHAPGEGKGTIRRGVGIGVATWGGGGHASKAKLTIHPDGSVEVELGSQDIGTGTRTCITMVAAESLGLPMSAVKVKVGKNSYPASGPSGGSTTIGGVSTSTRKAAINALEKLFEKVAPSLGVPPDQLEAVDSRIQVKGNPNKAMSWKQAAQKIGPSPIEEMGENVPAQAAREGLNTLGAAGVQMAEVEVDTETGIVKMRKMVAVQDCGLVVNPKTAESQVFGACIMSICSALFEERVMDQVTGRVLNPDMEFYKLAGLPDIGEIVVHMDIQEVHDKRGVIGLGEPCAIGGTAAIANAVHNALGVRIPMVPVTADRVLNALGNKRYA
ncbi:MAG: xanthine dehydrogenase family protein molybdopterin-binding subunit [Acidobacteria bacterium]|nr:xanthine dehydrogenase family protein molybdopterin-binding subunit [Acidobacteriota bacterium]